MAESGTYNREFLCRKRPDACHAPLVDFWRMPTMRALKYYTAPKIVLTRECINKLANAARDWQFLPPVTPLLASTHDVEKKKNENQVSTPAGDYLCTTIWLPCRSAAVVTA